MHAVRHCNLAKCKITWRLWPLAGSVSSRCPISDHEFATLTKLLITSLSFLATARVFRWPARSLSGFQISVRPSPANIAITNVVQLAGGVGMSRAGRLRAQQPRLNPTKATPTFEDGLTRSLADLYHSVSFEHNMRTILSRSDGM